jgi:hypothetical protein
MSPPSTYAQWSAYLDRLKVEGEDDMNLLCAMDEGTISWSSGVAENMARRFSEVFHGRLKAMNDKFQLDLNRANGHETNIARSIIVLRKRLVFLRQFVNLKPFHAEIGKSFNEALDKFCNSCQKALEDSAKSDRTGKLAYIIRNNQIIAEYLPLVPSGSDKTNNTNAMSESNVFPTSRKILI